MLEPDLRPIRPQPNSPESMQIYTEHRLVSIVEKNRQINVSQL